MWGKCLSIFYHAHRRKSIFSGKKVSARILCYVVDPDIIGFRLSYKIPFNPYPYGMRSERNGFYHGPSKYESPPCGWTFVFGRSVIIGFRASCEFDFCPHPQRGASRNQGILPQPKKQSTGLFLTLATLGPVFRIPQPIQN